MMVRAAHGVMLCWFFFFSFWSWAGWEGRVPGGHRALGLKRIVCVYYYFGSSFFHETVLGTQSMPIHVLRNLPEKQKRSAGKHLLVGPLVQLVNHQESDTRPVG